MRVKRRKTSGFTLLELLLTLVIVATALVTLGASVSTGIASASDSVNQRAAREVCRAKLEEAVATGQTTGGGSVDQYPGFQWSLNSQETTTGAADSPTEKYVVVTVTVTFPQDQAPAGSQPTGASPGSSLSGGTIKLSTIMNPPDLGTNGSSSSSGPGH